MLSSRRVRRCASLPVVAGLLVAATACDPPPPLADQIEVTRLDVPKPDASPVNAELNSRGDVVLTVDIFAGKGLYPAAYFWRDGEAEPELIAREGTQAVDISDKGHVVANGQIGGGLRRPFLWFKGEWTDLASNGAQAVSVNDHGTVAARAGFWYKGERVPEPEELHGSADPIVINPIVGLNNRDQVLITKADIDELIFHSWLWSIDEGEVIDLRDEVGEDVGNVIARGLNDRGMVLFNYDDPGGTRHNALWHDGEVTDLGPISPRLINDRGQVVGSLQDADGNRQAALWHDGEITVLEGLSDFRPQAINKRGQVVGFGRNADGLLWPYLWEDGRVTDLGVLVEDAEDFHSARPMSINDRGQIVGTAFGAEDEQFAVMWEVSPSWGHRPKG